MRLEHRAFLLRPEDEERRFTAYHLQHRQAAAERTGQAFALPEVGAPYPRSSFPALEAAKWVEARHPGQFDAFDLALFEAFFARTQDISNSEALRELAEQQGLPGDALVASLAAREFHDAVWADYRQALELGVTAIPTVIAAGYAISGAVPYEQYERLTRQLLSGLVVHPTR